MSSFFIYLVVNTYVNKGPLKIGFVNLVKVDIKMLRDGVIHLSIYFIHEVI